MARLVRAFLFTTLLSVTSAQALDGFEEFDGVSRSGKKSARITFEQRISENHGFSEAGYLSIFYHDGARGSKLFSGGQVLRSGLSSSESTLFQGLAQHDGFYQIRLPSSIFSQQSPSYVIASARARDLAASNFSETFELSLDKHGNIISLSIVLPNSSPDSAFLPSWDISPSFNSRVQLKHGLRASQVVRTVELLAAMEEGASSEGGGGKKPVKPKTFWEKYWMYCIPAGLMLLNGIMASAGPEPQTRPGAGGGRPAAAGGGSGSGGGGISSSAIRRR